METIETNKVNKEQITFKDKQIWAELKKLADQDNTGIGTKAKELLKAAIEKTQVKPVASSPEKEITSKESSNIEKVLEFPDPETAEKLEVVAELLSQIMASKNEYLQTESEARLEEAKEQVYDELISNNLVLRLSKSQKDVFIKLYQFRFDNGKKHSEKIEDLFFYMLKKYVEDDWSEPMPKGFKNEFKDAFVDYFNPKPNTINHVTIIDKLRELNKEEKEEVEIELQPDTKGTPKRSGIGLF